eukprot:COSAG04_NODE_64_length_29689_cov_158.096992_24_plen_189_part_00
MAVLLGFRKIGKLANPFSEGQKGHPEHAQTQGFQADHSAHSTRFRLRRTQLKLVNCSMFINSLVSGFGRRKHHMHLIVWQLVVQHRQVLGGGIVHAPEALARLAVVAVAVAALARAELAPLASADARTSLMSSPLALGPWRVGDPGGGVAGAVRVRRRGARNEGRRGGGALSACVGVSEIFLSLGAFL